MILLLPSPGFAKKTHDDILHQLYKLGFTEFSRLLETHSPDLVKQIGKSDDITVWAPGNYAIASRFGIYNLGKRDGQNITEAELAAQITDSHADNSGVDMQFEEPEDDGDDGEDYRRKVKRGHNNHAGPHRKNHRGANFETIYTFLDDPGYINLGDCQEARFVKNYAAPADGGACVATIEVTTGLGIVQNTLRGPFRFQNGVIYEVTNFFTLPQTFTTTMQHLNISRQFFDTVVHTGNVDLFEKFPAVTIFAPIDEYLTSTLDVNALHSHILWRQNVFGMLLTPDLLPGKTFYSKSGAPIKITYSKTGEKLVNGRRFIKPNVVTTNGVIHFIDGPLHDSGTGCKKKCNH